MKANLVNRVFMILVLVGYLPGWLWLKPTGYSRSVAAQELPTADQVIQRNLMATASREAIEQLRSMVVDASVSIPRAGVQGQVTIYQQRNGKAAMEIDLPPLGKQQFGMDGTHVWELSQSEAKILEGEEREQIRLQLTLLPIAHYHQLYDSVECIGAEEFEGQVCHVLKLQKGDFEPVYEYFSSTSGLQVGSKHKAITPAGRVEVVSVISDHRRVGDFTLPHKTVSKFPGDITQEAVIQAIKFNTDIPDEKLSMPDEVQALLKN